MVGVDALGVIAPVCVGGIFRHWRAAPALSKSAPRTGRVRLGERITVRNYGGNYGGNYGASVLNPQTRPMIGGWPASRPRITSAGGLLD
jgi:hypothetical protein